MLREGCKAGQLCQNQGCTWGPSRALLIPAPQVLWLLMPSMSLHPSSGPCQLLPAAFTHSFSKYLLGTYHHVPGYTSQENNTPT